ncbi:MAG: geranylgeranylglyceryl/heptaprenylglyceryl phosphate synthase [Nitrosopumilaceae archaeon]
MAGRVENYLQSQLKKKKSALIFVLIDSEVSSMNSSVKLAKEVEKIGASAILIGGSSASDQFEMANLVKNLKNAVKIPKILFPGNITGVVPHADAILFSSLLNSENPYFISQAQALGAPSVLKFGLEPLPTAYLVIGVGSSAWFFGSARGIPFDKPKIAAAYSLAAQFLGMRFVYLEAGSGAATSVEPEMVKTVRKVFKGFLIVGGGIRDAKTAKNIVKAGADALVIGTLLENKASLQKLTEIAKTIRNIKR